MTRTLRSREASSKELKREERLRALLHILASFPQNSCIHLSVSFFMFVAQYSQYMYLKAESLELVI